MSTGGGSEGFVDPNFVNELLGQVDQSDPLVQAALEQLNAANNNEKNEEKDESANKKHKGNDDK